VSRQRLRATFNEDAELYDRARPRYPSQLFADLTRFAPSARVLEIGCGTGQATLPLAQRGHRVTAVELGDAMAAVARHRLRAYPDVEIVTALFEDWPLPPDPYDMVFAATSFHWLDPEVRTAKAARALRTGGALAIVRTEHVAGGTEEFFAEVQKCYERFDPATPPGLRLAKAADLPPGGAEADASGWFAPAVCRRYEWEVPYTSAEYRNLLLTYSGHRALDPAARAALLSCVTGLIDRDFGGRIAKRYLAELQISVKA
jgi:SAM-dependent methyltransferase